MIANSANVNKTNNHRLPPLNSTEHKKTTSYMTLEIQVLLAWDGHKNVAELNRLMDSLHWKKLIYVTVFKYVQIPKFTPTFLVGLCCSIHSFLCYVLWTMFVFLSLFLWPLYCLSFVHLRLLVTPLVSSDFSYVYTTEPCPVPDLGQMRPCAS